MMKKWDESFYIVGCGGKSMYADLLQATNETNTNFTASHCTWSSNSAGGGFGGGIYMSGFPGGRAFASIFASVFSHNEVEGNGAGVSSVDVIALDILYTNFSSNGATVLGGGLHSLVRTCCFRSSLVLQL